METARASCLFLSLLLFICDGLHVLGPSGPLTVQLGDSVMLPCSVENPVPMEELEVEWKRNDSGSLVHLWQDGESRPESQDQRYHERAHFFTEEIIHGNFSLLLTNVTREDAGVYKCVVYTNLESDETLIEIKEIERLIVSGAHVISAYAGEDITLNCSVDSHITPENIEEISWKKMDEDILVLLYQDGEVLTDSSHNRYRDRAEFFSAEERNKGNFSLRLKEVRTEDKGLYTCEAFSGELSDNTTVEVQQLGFSSMHYGIVVFCILGFVIGSLILGCLAYTSFINNDDNRRALAIQCAHVLCPNITMAIVYILWGVTEGSFTEAATCSALNFARILLLVWIAGHLKAFSDYPRRFINRLAIPLEYAVICVVVYSPLIVDVWHKQTLLKTSEEIVRKLGLLIFPLMWPLLILLYAMCSVCSRRILQKQTNFYYLAAEFNNVMQILSILIMYGLRDLKLLTVAAFPFLPVICFFCQRFFLFLLWICVLMILEVLSASTSIYVHHDLKNIEEEREALTCVTAFLHILTMMALFTSQRFLPKSDSRNTRTQRQSHSRNTATERSLSHMVVFMFGAVVVVFVNAVALLVELILTARTGQRTVDLRLILLPVECVFAVCCLALQISAVWKKKRKILIKDINRLRQICGCKQQQRVSQPQREETELENLSPVPQSTAS